ncbi:MAG: T9SS type A sorting domain-containing protein, partial [Bacteroidales bacterium]|nr:T9SS type A sorting domain-containing protein [Bacteroidales bacterium]
AYTINAFANDSAWGSVELVSDCDAATLTATANNCYEFVSWSDGNTENPRVLTLTGDTEITAVFAQAELGSSITATICEGSSYSENGFETNEAGVYTQTLQTENGCDSIVELTLSIAPVYNEVIEATINAGETYTENGFNESETGTYVQTLQSEFGCDSTITLNLLVNASLMDVEGVEVSFYPNPTKANLSFNMMIEKIEVIDLSGRMLMSFENANNINIESLPIGTYYLLLHLKDKAIMRKIVKQ